MTPTHFQQAVDEFAEECCKDDGKSVTVACCLTPGRLSARITLPTPLGQRTVLVKPMFWNPFSIYIDVEGKGFFANNNGLYKALWYAAELELTGKTKTA